MRALAELLTIVACCLTIGGFAVRFLMDRNSRRRAIPSHRDEIKRLEAENRELDELLDNIRGSDKEREKPWRG